MLTDAQRAVLTQRLRRGRENMAAGIPRRPAGLTDLPLSFGQEQLWFIDRFAPGEPTYNIPLALALSGPLDRTALGRAMDQLIERHEPLRTRLVPGERGRPTQVIDPPASRPLELTDLSGSPPDERRARLREYIDTEAVRPFTLASDRLLRTWLLRLADDEHMLIFVVHHTVFDGWSAGVLLRELAALYRQEAGGEPASLAELPVQFADYALWERGRLRGAMLTELEDYWRGALAGFETVPFPTDRPRPVLEDFAGGLAQHMTDLELLDGLRDLSRREGTTLFVILMAALQALLYRYTGQTDLVVGTASASRTRPELAPLIGFLVNTLPIRVDLSGDPTFTNLVGRVREATAGAYGHQDLPFSKLVQTLRVDRDPGRAPVFQIALTYAERDAAAISAAGVDFTLTDLVVGINAAKLDLDFAAEARSDGLWFECSYKTGLFDPATARRLLGNLEVLLRGVVADSSARLSRLPMLTERELCRELAEWNDTAAPFPAVCIHQGFEAQAARSPGAIAAEFDGQFLSYAELNRQANQIARRLCRLGVGAEVLVGVCMVPGLRRLAGLLGIMKAGGGYVPLDPALPAGRLSFIVADTAMSVILTDEPSAWSLPAAADSNGDDDGRGAGGGSRSGTGSGAVPVLSLDADWEQIRGLDDTDLDHTELTGARVVPANVAYVIYTSGSTGQPKGVAVEHRQVVNFLHGMIEQWQVAAPDRVLGFASLSFDSSVQDMFMPLLAGARMVLASAETLHSPARLATLIRDRRVTFACLTPSVLSLLGHQQFADLRVLMCGGEQLSSELARRWVRPGLRFVNDYGPTEATVSATNMVLDASTLVPPPIGRPSWPNYRAYVLDSHLNPVPVGVTGEMHIGGASVARGYLNRSGLTAERFIADPFTPGQRLYRTGDLVRRRPDGTIVFIGRADGQVKFRGLRIELGEIEAALAGHPAIAQAVATVVTDPVGDQQLAAYLRPEPAGQPGLADLRAHLARILPGYMIPAHLITVEAFRLNTSGKIDHSALPAPHLAPAGTQHAAPATRTETVLAGLYSAVLSREQVSATDSFFDLGGSSLAVMRLVDMISIEVGVDVGVATVFLHPTPRQLATRIDAISSGTARPGSGSLVELSTGAGQLPLFLIHAVGGTVFAYARLAAELSGTFKVYGLEAPGLSQAGATAATLDDLAHDYTERIRAAQPAGPYRLAGWSMGGVVAFEVARRLEQAGAEVCLLALLDAPFSLPDTGVPAQPQLAAMFLADAAHSLGWDQATLPDPASTSAADQLTWLAARLGDGDRSGPAIARLRDRFDVFGAHTQMLAGYQPALPAVGAPTLIVSADHSPNAPARAHWPKVLTGPVRTHPADSDHYTFLRPPQVTDTSTAIVRWHAVTGQPTCLAAMPNGRTLASLEALIMISGERTMAEELRA